MPIHERDYMREDAGRRGLRGITAFQLIVGLNAAVFVAQYVFELGWVVHPLTGERLMPMGGVSVHELGRGHVWTLLTYMFVHGSVGHFLVNMMLLWFTGRAMQARFGSRHTGRVFVIGGLVGAAAELLMNAYVRDDTTTLMVGASASAFALLMALAVATPDEEITALIYFVIPVRMRLWTLAKALFLIQLAFGLVNLLFDVLPEGLRIAYFAHLGGAAAGWLYARNLGYGSRPWKPLSQWQPPPLVRRHALVRSRTRQTAEHEKAASPPPDKLPETATNLIEEVINPLLDKINQHGKDSLTEAEKLALERASRELHRQQQG